MEWRGILINPPQAVVRDFEFKRKLLTEKLFLLNRAKLELKYIINGSILGSPVSVESLHNIRLFTVNEITFSSPQLALTKSCVFFFAYSRTLRI